MHYIIYKLEYKMKFINNTMAAGSRFLSMYFFENNTIIFWLPELPHYYIHACCRKFHRIKSVFNFTFSHILFLRFTYLQKRVIIFHSISIR